MALVVGALHLGPRHPKEDAVAKLKRSSNMTPSATPRRDGGRRTTVAIAMTARLRGPTFIRLLVALLLTVGGPLVGLRLLAVHDPPGGPLGPVGFVPPAPVRAGAGFAAGVSVKVFNCSDPVLVTVVVAGTRDYWIEHVKGPRWSPFFLTLPDTRLTKLLIRVPPRLNRLSDFPTLNTGVVGLSDSVTDLTQPQYAHDHFDQRSPLSVRASIRLSGKNGTAISGEVADWHRTLQPLVVMFPARWTVPRALSSCYLQLPSLSSAPTTQTGPKPSDPRVLLQSGAKQATTHVTAQGGHATAAFTAAAFTTGIATVTVRQGAVTADASIPTPAGLSGGDFAWICRSVTESVGPLTTRGRGPLPDIVKGIGRAGALSVPTIEDATSGNCSAVATIAEDSAAYSRDFVLVLVAAVTSIGITLLVDLILDWVGGRRDGPSPRAPRSPSPSPRRQG